MSNATTNQSYEGRGNVFCRGQYLGDFAKFEDGSFRRSAHVDAVRYDSEDDVITSMVVQHFGTCHKSLRDDVEIKAKV